MLCHVSVIRSCADYRMPSVPVLGGVPHGGRANTFPPLGSAILTCLVAVVGLMAAMALETHCHGHAACQPWCVRWVAALRLFWLAVLRVLQHLPLLLCSTFCVERLLAPRWPCRVWWAQLTAAPLGAAAEAWQPLVPVAYDRLGDSWCEVSMEWSAGAGRLDFMPLFFAQC